MKLKKIASLMLAGIMAVSMLAACGSTTPNTDDDTVVTPVDNSFAASINSELNDKQKAIVTFETSSELTAAVNAIADKFDSNMLTITNGWVPGTHRVVVDFKDMMDAKSTIDDIDERATSNKTYASVMIVLGKYTDEGMTKEVLGKVDDYINTTYMPNDSINNKYRYTYAGDIAVSKVESLSGDVSAYVVGVVIDQTVTEVQTNT